ncbi:MAG: hypothetical protein K0S33_3221 [Bacteroidetes bacterium]|jgi:hypothetical protein|nr:hypothetical protein [Bacteroidota bacterium]
MKPKFFISSTIHDFKDLRSCIKWWLKQNGYSVNASEFNDFDKPLDYNSYEACLKAIDNSEYFILLIGDRVGGMYDQETTITQKEYQYAYNRMLEGKLKIINFIRLETWTKFQSDHKLINNKEFKSSNKEEGIKILLYRFIDNVRRVEEMGRGEKPKNNWIHPFNVFSDIVDVLNMQLGSRIELGYKANRFITYAEIVNNLKEISKIGKDGSLEPIAYLEREIFIDFKYDFSMIEKTLTEEQHQNYSKFYIGVVFIKELRLNRMESLYKSGFFLQYDSKKDDYYSGDLNELALKLINNYESINSLIRGIKEKSTEKLGSLKPKSDKSHLVINPIDILFAFKMYERMVDCINYSKNIYRLMFDLQYKVPVEFEYFNGIEGGRPNQDKEIEFKKAVLSYFKLAESD